MDMDSLNMYKEKTPATLNWGVNLKEKKEKNKQTNKQTNKKNKKCSLGARTGASGRSLSRFP